MRSLRSSLVLLAAAVVTIVLAWAAAILLRTPFSGTDLERAAVREVLERLGVAASSPRTLVVVGSAPAAVPPERVFAVWSRLEGWPGWSRPLHVESRWLGEPGWRAGSRFEQKLSLGFPVGTVVSRETVSRVTPGEDALWCKDEGGVASCHLWRFVPVGAGRTRIVNVEVFHGVTVGLIAPFVASRWTRLFDEAAAGLARAAEAGDGPAAGGVR